MELWGGVYPPWTQDETGLFCVLSCVVLILLPRDVNQEERRESESPETTRWGRWRVKHLGEAGVERWRGSLSVLVGTSGPRWDERWRG